MAGREQTTPLAPDAGALDRVEELGINVCTVAQSRRRKWLADNADAFKAQADWHERNGHPSVDIIAAPGGSSWSPWRQSDL